MNPAAILKQSAADGVILSLSVSGSVKASGDQDQVNKWLLTIREHKISIIAALSEAANDVDNLACYAWLIHFQDRDSLKVTFTPEATHSEALASYPDAVAAEPVPSLPPADGDDRRVCLDCASLKGGACSVAAPGGVVSAPVG